MTSKTKMRLGDILVSVGTITSEQLDHTLKTKNPDQKLGDALIKNGYITEQQLIEVLEFQLGIPHVNLHNYPIDRNVMTIITEKEAKQKEIIPLKKEGNTLTIAMADPLDMYAVEELRLLTGFKIERVIATREDIRRATNRYYQTDDSMKELINQVPKENNDERDLSVNSSPIARLVNQLLSNAVDQHASDIHIDPHESKILIRYRIDGLLKTERALPKDMQSILLARIKIMASLNITESRLPQDGRVKLDVDEHHVDLRVSTLPTMFGEKVVIRILDTENTLHSPGKLGLTQDNLRTFINLIDKPNGIVLITGPTGSGKTSTLYAALNHLNTETVNIITIEDPVEYQLEGINQIQVNHKIGLTFANGLRSILRQDPNIIMVGEIRDTETAEMAVRSSLTGHLVLSTIHTNDSIGTITRLVDMDIEPFLIASSLTGVVAQRLIRKTCRDCGKYEDATIREKEIFGKQGLEIDKVYRGGGCRSCNMTGYRGRMAIHEFLIVDSTTRGLIMKNESASKIRHYFIEKNMKFLIDDGLLKVTQGLTTTEEVLRVVTGVVVE